MIKVALNGGEVCGGGGKVTIVIYSIAANRPSNPLFLNFVRSIRRDHADVGHLLVRQFCVMGDEEYVNPIFIAPPIGHPYFPVQTK